MIKIADPNRIDRCILEFAAERGVGGTGRALGTIRDIMRDRGFPPEEVDASIQTLKKRGHIDYRRVEPGRKSLDDPGTVVAITTEGKELLRQMRATMQFNVRLPEEFQAELAGFVGKAGDSVSAVAVTALKEWARAQRFPGIDFRWTPSGRQPCVTGTGLKVWDVYRIWLDHGENVEKIERNYANLNRNRVNAAVAYAKAFIHEMPEGAFGKRPPFAAEIKV
ncbi:MAG: DUF433 domain-containing protein [Planctomycetes bacterium]|nr:DUF433 domain-containing protein [Planctomycetota bacterium]